MGSASAERVGKEEVGWDYPQGAVHMAATRLSCKRDMVSTRSANSCHSRMKRLKKCLLLSACMGSFISCQEGCVGSELVFAK